MTSPPALLLVSHGSVDPRAAAVSESVAEAARDALGQVEVTCAYLGHSAPSPADALVTLADSGQRSVVAVPFLLGSAFHALTDLPAGIADARARRPELDVRVTAALGADPLVVRAVQDRLAELGSPPGHGSVVLFVSAGSTDAASQAEGASVALAVSAQTGCRVVLASVSGDPSPATALTTLAAEGVREVAVLPYLLAPGRFSAAVDAAATVASPTLRVLVADVLGPHPALVELVLARYRSAAAG